jgi:hypothetical protein
MPVPSPAEIGKLSGLGLLRHYQQKQSWYIQQGKLLVAGAKFGVSATKTTSGAAYVFSQDEVANMLRLWLIVDQQWLALLQSKPNVPNSQYDTLTDAMSRFIAYDAYAQIIS